MTKENRIKNRSKKWIAGSLIDLLKKKPYKTITVEEICNGADLVRRTFYNNFKSKDDVIKYYLEYIFDEYWDIVSKQKEVDRLKVFQIYFNYLYNHIDFLNSLFNNNLFYMMLIVQDERIHKLNKLIFNDDSKFADYLSTFSSAGLCAVLYKWIVSGIEETPDEIAEIYYKITNLHYDANNKKQQNQ